MIAVDDGAHAAQLRLLARHQWVRAHGTPRVSTLVGDRAQGRALWADWLRLAGRVPEACAPAVAPDDAGAAWMTTTATQALARASEAPGEPIAIVIGREAFARWRGGRDDRLAAFVAEGVIELAGELGDDHAGAPPARAPVHAPLTAARARSLAELALYDALEATPATAGRFALNEPLSFHFGGRAAEADLLSRADDLVLEVDGYHHFTDAAHYRRDRRKDLLLQAHGYVVLRFLAEDILADAPAAVRAVVELLGVRAASLRGHTRRKG